MTNAPKQLFACLRVLATDYDTYRQITERLRTSGIAPSCNFKTPSDEYGQDVGKTGLEPATSWAPASMTRLSLTTDLVIAPDESANKPHGVAANSDREKAALRAPPGRSSGTTPATAPHSGRRNPRDDKSPRCGFAGRIRHDDADILTELRQKRE
jgi:hypothetical protein